MLVSYKGAQPQILPAKYSGLTESEILALGFVICTEKPMTTPGQRLWWENGDWSIQDPNESEIAVQWQAVKTQCVYLLAKTDYKVIKAYEQGVSLSSEWVAYRQAIRDIHNDVNSINPFAVAWPEQPA